MEMTELQSCFGEREGSSGALKKKKKAGMQELRFCQSL